jgi:predicted small lipoprotein YifL
MKNHNSLIKLLFLLPIALMVLSACGIKPGHLDAPTAEKTENFPATYPSSAE